MIEFELYKTCAKRLVARCRFDVDTRNKKPNHKKHGQWLKSDLVSSTKKVCFFLFLFLKLTQSIEQESYSSMCCFAAIQQNLFAIPSSTTLNCRKPQIN